MKKILTGISAFLVFGIILSGNVSAAKYSVQIDVYPSEKPLSRQPFTFFLDFKKEISLSSLKMSPTTEKDKDIKIPVYAVPLSKYKALVHFMPHKAIAEDGELHYLLTFADGKWDGKAAGDAALKKDIEAFPNLIPNYSFEKVHKAIDRFLTWSGKVEVVDWRLMDYPYRFASVQAPESSCRSSSNEAIEGTHSLCFKSGKPRNINGRELLVSGSAYSQKSIPLKPNTAYKLSFFVKVTKHLENQMNFQGLGVSLNLQDSEKNNLLIGAVNAFYSIRSKTQDEYLNKWIYVQACDATAEGTCFGRVNIAEKISGTTYVDMVELREMKENALPEITVGEIATEK